MAAPAGVSPPTVEGWLTSPPTQALEACPASRGDGPFSILVADRDRDAIVRLDPDGVREDLVTASAHGETNPEYIDRPVDVALGPAGDVYVANFGRGSILRFDAESGAYLGIAFHDVLVLEEPSALHWMDDRLLVVGNDSGNVLTLDTEGQLLGTAGDGWLRGPLDLAVEPSTGLVHVTAQATGDVHGVQAWDLETSERDSDYGPREMLGITVGVTFDCRGDVIVAGPTGVHLLEPDQDGGFAPVRALSTQPASRLRTDPAGDVWMSSRDGLSRLDRSAGAFVLVHEADDLLVDPRGFTFE